MPLKSMTTPCIQRPTTTLAQILLTLYLTKLVSYTIPVFIVTLVHLQIILKIFEVHPKDIGHEAVTIVSIPLKKSISSSNMHNILLKHVLIPLHFIPVHQPTPSTSNTPLITPH